MTDQQRKELLKSQQGEIDAVLMYNALADVVSNAEDAEVFRRLAAEEGHHGAIFRNYTDQVLRPKRTKAIMLPMLYRLIGKERLYPLIAKGEYSAEKAYEHLIQDFPEVENVRNDEKRHGDTVMGLLHDTENKAARTKAGWATVAVGTTVFAVTWALLSRRNRQ